MKWEDMLRGVREERGELFRTLLKDKDYQTNLLARAVAPLDRLFGGLGDQVEKRRRTYTSWFGDKDFLDLPALAARLRSGPQQDPLSKYLYDNLSPKTQALLSGQGNEARLRRSLSEDLNVLLERELKIKDRLNAKKREKDAADQEIADGSTSERLRREQERLAKEIADEVVRDDCNAGFVASNPRRESAGSSRRA
jgi:hypothetical protein